MPENQQMNAPDRIPRATFIGLFIANMAAMLGMGILLPILTPFAKKLGASGAIVGMIFASYALARGIFSPFVGRISDKYGRKSFMLVGLALYAILALGYSLLHSALMLAVLWFFQGVASAMVTPIAQSYIGDITPLGKEGRVMNLFYLGQFGGIAVGPVIGGYLADNVSMNAPFYVMCVAAVIGFGLVYFVVKKSPAIKKRKESKHEEKNQKANFKESFKTVVKDREMKGILSYIVGRGFYRWGFNSFFPIYAVTIASLSKGQIGLIISSYMVTGTLLQYPFGSLADRFSNYRGELVGIGGLIAALSMLLVPSAHHMFWLIVLVVIMGVFSAVSRASTVAIRTERGRYHGQGAVTGVFTAGFSAGQVLGPVGFGIIVEFFNIPDSFYFGALIGLLTTAMAYWYLRNGKEGAQST